MTAVGAGGKNLSVRGSSVTGIGHSSTESSQGSRGAGGSRTFQFEVWGEPVPQSRTGAKIIPGHRFPVRFDSPKSRAWKQVLRAVVQTKLPPDWALFDGGVVLRCTFVMPAPKAILKKMARYPLLPPPRHTKKPDLDNLLKAVKDALKGVVWRDDAQVDAYRHVRKVYGPRPGVQCSLSTDDEGE